MPDDHEKPAGVSAGLGLGLPVSPDPVQPLANGHVAGPDSTGDEAPVQDKRYSALSAIHKRIKNTNKKLVRVLVSRHSDYD
jgi:hypothetical protein